MHSPDRNCVEVNAVETPNVDGPNRRVGPWPPEWLNAAVWAEVVFRSAGVEGVEPQVLKWRE
jgi:hypothetical protein